MYHLLAFACVVVLHIYHICTGIYYVSGGKIICTSVDSHEFS